MSEGVADSGAGFDEAERAAWFTATWDRLEADYFARLEAAYRRSEGWRERFRAGALETMRLAEEHPQAARFLAVEALAFGELGRRRQRALGVRLATLLDTAREELDDPAAVPEVTAQWILSIFFHRLHGRLSTAAGPDLLSQLPELMFLAVSAYFGTEAGLAELDLLP